ncbi:hypothetical protein KIW84_015359 [Lathyrus oleraceus]|uniref:Uncharacterized protein n=1 Tax=Pisum sativum TaxID=3888 RepID=A0A9D5BQK8_PEA|nr:hypothetical protein KIW84_015359 [Pisum sativum]
MDKEVEVSFLRREVRQEKEEEHNLLMELKQNILRITEMSEVNKALEQNIEHLKDVSCSNIALESAIEISNLKIYWPRLKLESNTNHTSICQVMPQEPRNLIRHPCSMNLLQCKSRIWTTSECYLQLENTKDLSAIAQPDHTNGNIRFAHYYKVVEQECKNLSFINNLNFKNIAGLRGLNFECFSDEVYACIEESSLSALSKMIQAFVDIYGHSFPEGFMSWQDVYKYYILSSLSALESKSTTNFSSRTPECIQKNLSKLEQSYDSCRKYIRLLSQSVALTIMTQYLTVIVPLHSSYRFLPDNSIWQECLIVLLNFWMGLTDDMKEFSLEENSGDDRYMAIRLVLGSFVYAVSATFFLLCRCFYAGVFF